MTEPPALPRRPRIAWLPGDGIGPEVCRAARYVLDTIGFEGDHDSWSVGWDCWSSHGDALPSETIQAIRSSNVVMFGAISSFGSREAEAALPKKLRGQGLRYRSPIVRIRQEFDLYAKLIHAPSFEGAPRSAVSPVDFVVVRENSEGLYSGVEMFPTEPEVRRVLRSVSTAMARFDACPNEEMALAVRVITRPASIRIARVAFEEARRRSKTRVTLVEKPNVLRETSGLVEQCAREVSAEYPGIEFEVVNVDAMMMSLVKTPGAFQVILASNLFGDIVSDLCAQLAGGIGLVATANLGDSRAVFEPLHGSAPKYTGLDRVNPTGAILSAAMMLEWLGDCARAEWIREGVRRVIRSGTALTRDLGGSAGTRAMTDAIGAASLEARDERR